jgi:hypothetical protein
VGVYNKWLHDNRYNSNNEFIMHEEGTHADNIAPGPCTDGGGLADIWESIHGPLSGMYVELQVPLVETEPAHLRICYEVGGSP